MMTPLGKGHKRLSPAVGSNSLILESPHSLDLPAVRPW